MNEPERRNPGLPLSMLIAEAAYRLVVLGTRLLRWFTVAVLRPLRLIV